MKKPVKWLPAVAIMLIIFVISSISGPFINSVGLGKETYHINGHFFLFVALSIAFYYATGKVVLSVVMTIIFGIFDEMHQVFTPFRSSSDFDILVDSIGAFIGGIISWKFWPTISRKLKNLLRK